jgi:hypothetical protein
MTPFDFLIILLSALTLHRVWNYENITADAREWTEKIPYVRKVFCPPCSAFWIGLLAVLLWMHAPFPVSATLAAIMPARIMVWVYARMATPPAANVTFPPTTTAKYDDRAAKAVQEMNAPLADALAQPPVVGTRSVIIMTALGDFNPSYSVATAVLDQATAIGLANPDWTVEVWVMQNADLSLWSAPPNVKVRAVIR